MVERIVSIDDNVEDNKYSLETKGAIMDGVDHIKIRTYGISINHINNEDIVMHLKSSNLKKEIIGWNDMVTIYTRHTI